ncbi:MAG TPA: hypothetical protein VMN82_11810 [Thermoanaerobaculia bacterium]|nr:hypothetical protein [Thermoanaerobaculia bacterium]
MKRLAGMLAMLAGSACTWGCAFPQSPVHVPDATIYDGTRDVMQYRSPIPKDVQPAVVTGQQALGVACSTTISFPPLPPALFLGSESVINYIPWPSFTVGAGDRGYAAAMREAHEAAGDAALVDVRADLHTTAVLGIWRRDCTEVHAAVARKTQ